MGARSLTIAAFLLVTSAPALATVIPTLDFNNVWLNVAEGNGLGLTGSSMHIQSGLTNSLHGAGLPLAVYATVTGGLATNSYNGEGKVVGDTLGTADHALTNDTFIINNGFGVNGGSKSDSFTITFTGLKIYSLSFDYEIFPDISCAKGSPCQLGSPGIISLTNPWPDIELWIDGSTTPFWKAPALPGDNPQRLDTSPTLYFPGGTYTLTFKDWPAEVGVNNLTINRVPEPSPLALVGLALAVLALVRWWVQRGVGPTLTGATAH